MKPLMLLAHLCGEGERTEARLQGMGLGDLESVAATSPVRLMAGLRISQTAAERMIEEARGLIDSPNQTEESDPGPETPSQPHRIDHTPLEEEDPVTVLEIREIREGEHPDGGHTSGT